MKKLWKNKVARVVIIVVGVLLVIGIGFATHHGADPVDVSAVALKPKSLIVKLPENGILSLPQTASIAAQATGNVLHVYAREGQKVHQGDLLMKLDDRLLITQVESDRAVAAQAQAGLTSAQARLQADINAKSEGQISGGLGAASIGVSGASQLVQAEQTLVNARSAENTAKETYDADATLFKINGMPRQQLDRDKAAYDEAVANYAAAQRQYDLLKQQLHETSGQLDTQIEADQSAVASAQAQVASAAAGEQYHAQQLADTEVRAPFDGVIQTLGTSPTSTAAGPASLAEGDAITLGQVLFTIAGAGAMVVKAQVDEQDIINVKVGQRAIITGEDFPGRTLSGMVARIAAVVVQQTSAGTSAKDVETTISLDKAYPFLRAGMSCDVDIITGRADGALVVPLSAVFDDGDKHFVYVVKDQKTHKVQVSKGLASDTEVVITKGLAEKDVVATTNIKQLKEGALVKTTMATPAPSGSASPPSTAGG
jgi:HlyD family secretion protein